MDYSKWLSRTFQQLVGNAHIWILSAPLILLAWLAQFLNGTTLIGFQARMQQMMNNPEVWRDLAKADTPLEMILAMPRIYAHIFGMRLSFIFLGMFIALLLWVLGFVFKGAIIHQTMPTQEAQPPWQESLHVGLNRAPHIFLIDLILILPVLVVMGAFLLVMVLVMSMGMAQPGEGLSNMAGILLPLFCILSPLLVLYALFMVFFQPLAYQACVQEALSAVKALRRAWHVFRQHLGPAIVLGIIVVVVSLAFGVTGGIVISPVRVIIQFSTGMWSLIGLGVWAAVALIYATLSIAIQLFQLILYASAWPDLAEVESAS